MQILVSFTYDTEKKAGAIVGNVPALRALEVMQRLVFASLEHDDEANPVVEGVSQGSEGVQDAVRNPD